MTIDDVLARLRCPRARCTTTSAPVRVARGNHRRDGRKRRTGSAGHRRRSRSRRDQRGSRLSGLEDTLKADVTAVSTLMRLPARQERRAAAAKAVPRSMRTTVPMFEAIIRQGCDKDVFDTDYPHEAAVIVTKSACTSPMSSSMRSRPTGTSGEHGGSHPGLCWPRIPGVQADFSERRQAR